MTLSDIRERMQDIRAAVIQNRRSIDMIDSLLKQIEEEEMHEVA
jgi:hypothetical protein